MSFSSLGSVLVLVLVNMGGRVSVEKNNAEGGCCWLVVWCIVYGFHDLFCFISFHLHLFYQGKHFEKEGFGGGRLISSCPATSQLQRIIAEQH